MGGDGGSIPTRSDLVKLKDKEKKADPHEQQKIRLSYCTMSNQPLSEPIVVDELGNLYNKEHVLKYLVDRKSNPDKHYDAAFQHIHSTKEVVTLQLTPIAPGAASEKKEQKSGDGSDTFKTRWVCPVTILEANGKNRFFAMRPCGCVLSERALKEVPSATCLRCTKAIKADSSILLAPSKEEYDEQKAKTEQRARDHKEHRDHKDRKEERKDKREKKDEKRKAEDSIVADGKRQALVAVVAPAAAGVVAAEKPEKKEAK